MPRASDYQLASDGLRAFQDALARNAMFSFQQEQAAEGKRRQEQEFAERVAARLQQEKAREAMFELQKEEAAARAAERKATAEYRAGEVNRRNRLDTERTQTQADAAARQNAFSNLLSGGETPLETSQFEHLVDNTGAGGDPLTPANILKAGAQTGALAPQQLAENALRQQALTAKEKPAAQERMGTWKIGDREFPYLAAPNGTIHFPPESKPTRPMTANEFVNLTKLAESYDEKISEVTQQIKDTTDGPKRKELYDIRTRLLKAQEVALAWREEHGPKSGYVAPGGNAPEATPLFPGLNPKGPGAASPTPASQPAAKAAIADGQTATNPSTGEKIIFRNGSWHPLK